MGRTGAGLEFYLPWEVPEGASGVFDYTVDVDTLFSVEVIPPGQGDLKKAI